MFLYYFRILYTSFFTLSTLFVILLVIVIKFITIELRVIILLHQVFNPNLIGYSTGTGEFISTNAKLNIAFPVAATEDAFQQARILVQRIKNNPKINVMKQWKVLTL